MAQAVRARVMRNQLIKRRGFARSKRRAIYPIRLHRRPQRAYEKIAEGLREVLEMVRGEVREKQS